MVLENIIRHCMLRNEDNHEDFELINDRNIMSWENYFRIYSWAHQCPAFSNGAAASLSPSTAWSARWPPPSSSTSITSRGTQRSLRTTPRFVKPWLVYFWIMFILIMFFFYTKLTWWQMDRLGINFNLIWSVFIVTFLPVRKPLWLVLCIFFQTNIAILHWPLEVDFAL